MRSKATKMDMINAENELKPGQLYYKIVKYNIFCLLSSTSKS